MDPTTPPGDDFSRYCNGRWIDAAQIPGENAHLTVRREGQTMDVPVTVGLRPSTNEE